MLRCQSITDDCHGHSCPAQLRKGKRKRRLALARTAAKAAAAAKAAPAALAALAAAKATATTAEATLRTATQYVGGADGRSAMRASG